MSDGVGAAATRGCGGACGAEAARGRLLVGRLRGCPEPPLARPGVAAGGPGSSLGAASNAAGPASVSPSSLGPAGEGDLGWGGRRGEPRRPCVGCHSVGSGPAGAAASLPVWSGPPLTPHPPKAGSPEPSRPAGRWCGSCPRSRALPWGRRARPWGLTRNGKLKWKPSFTGSARQ